MRGTRDGGAGDDAASAYLPLAAPNHTEQERRSALERLASCSPLSGKAGELAGGVSKRNVMKQVDHFN